MRIKSYYAQTIPEAMERARLELGAEAMILASNKTSGDGQRFGNYEVVFGVAEAAPDPKPVVAPAVAKPPQSLERMKDRMEDLRKSLSSKRQQATAGKTQQPAKLSNALANAGFPRTLADDIAGAVNIRSRDKKQDLMATVRNELTARISVSPQLGVIGYSRAIVALVGPAGVGKTTTAAKLAVGYGLLCNRPTRLISTDTHRIGGTDLLRRYAHAMGVQFEAPLKVDALERCLDAGHRNELVLIDTPGYLSPDSERSSALASVIAKRADIDVHLVLPAYASAAGLTAMSARFKRFLPSRLLFTGVDECASVASMLAYSIESGLPISFTGCGPEVPEDLQAASPSGFLSQLLPGLGDAAESAA